MKLWPFVAVLVVVLLAASATTAKRLSAERQLADNILREVFADEQKEAAKETEKVRTGTLKSVTCPTKGKCDTVFTHDDAGKKCSKKRAAE